MKNNELERQMMIKEIERVTDEISDIWNDLNIYNIKRLNEIWNDSITKEYIDKYEKANVIMQSIETSLENLKTCWKKDIEEQEIIEQ